MSSRCTSVVTVWALGVAAVLGPIAARAGGDYDGDGDVDHGDFAQLPDCYSGARGLLTGCGVFDFDDDSDVDLADFAEFHRVFGASIPPGMAHVPGGEFQMGDTFGEGYPDERPVHGVYVDAMYMDTCEVTNQQYATGLNWALSQGNLITVSDTGVVWQFGSGDWYPYCDTTTSHDHGQITWDGSAFGVVSGKEDYPVVLVSWYGTAAYCNWRSAMEGKPLCFDVVDWSCDLQVPGYRLATEAEWEKGARGGAAGHRFPWPDSETIQHARANYRSFASYAYDTSPTRGYHPTFSTGAVPYTSPVGYFAANGYGLHDMAGNVEEWCYDGYSSTYYSESPWLNPTGPEDGSSRMLRGGSWASSANSCRAAHRDHYSLTNRDLITGFRCVARAP